MPRLSRGVVAELGRQVDLLRREVRQLREEIHREVRTRRVAVVDEDDIVRVVLAARHRAGIVQARLEGEELRPTGIEVFAVEATGDLDPQIGIEILRAGDADDRWPVESLRVGPGESRSGTPPGT